MALNDEDFNKRLNIDNEETKYDKNGGWDLIVIPEGSDGSWTGHEYFSIHDDIFDGIQ